MTTANKITIVRILLVPCFLVQLFAYVRTGNELHRFIALLAFAVAAITDGVDGYIARRYNQKTEAGAILDPLADKLLLVFGLLVLSQDHQPYFQQLPWWLAATVFGRDIILMIGAVIIHQMFGRITLRPHFTGKGATFFQMITVVWALLKWNAQVLGILCLLTTALTAISGLIYVWRGFAHLASRPSPAVPGR